MDAASHERWQRIESLLDAALDLPEPERAPFLRAECRDDARLLAEVMQLLEASQAASSLLDSTAVRFAADLLARSATAQPVTPAPVIIGPWRIVRELGRGGMGAVYLAEREAHFRQRAALKLVHRGLHLDDELVRRFIDERQILASLEHAGIARLLDGGVTAEGVPWFAMEYVEGEPIERWCDARRLSIDARLELFCTVCDAVEYAHRQQVIHRDLKPSNIQVRADGTVKLLDFGIARLIAPDDDAASLTRAGLRIFTPEYASPEQIRGETATPASDVYSLGVLLYELLTGHRPYRVTGRTTSDVEKAVLAQDPARPSTAVLRPLEAVPGTGPPAPSPTQIARSRESTPDRLSERLRGELDRIVLQAMAKDPAHRYASALALAADVRNHLEGRPVSARLRLLPRTRALLALSAVFLAIVGGALLRRALAPQPVTDVVPTLAMGLIADYRTDRTTELARPLAEMLATNLARLPGLRVVSSSRIYELISQLDGDADDPGAHGAAARRAGATGLIDGALFALDSTGLRLDLRRVDLATGDVIAVHSITGADLFSLVDSGTARLAAETGMRTRLGSVADVTTHSEVAYRLYAEGVRAYYLRDVRGARRLLEAALAEDSALAMASYYLARMAPLELRHIEHALRVAESTSDRERLIIRALWADWTLDPSLVATAETLTVRYPSELDGYVYSGRALFLSGDYSGALRRFRQVLDRVPTSSSDNATRCAACDALDGIINAYASMDSMGAAVREAEAWAALQPQNAAPWLRIATIFGRAGNVIEGRRAYRRAVELDPSLSGLPYYYAYLYMTAGDFTTTDAALREIVRSGSPEQQASALSYLGISLRWQGRYTEALELLRPPRTPVTEAWTPAAKRNAVARAQLLFDLGRHREALALFDTVADLTGDVPSQDARDAAAALALAAEVRAALRDTTVLAALVDTIRALGSKSLLAGDQRLHHYIHGLLHAARGADDSAIDEFRHALTSPLMGSVRPHYALARVLLRRGRPREAIEVLRPVVVGPIEGTGRTVARTELHEILAQAWDALGRRDSALVHLRTVALAWQNADPVLNDRVEAVRSRIAALEAARRN